MGFIPIPGERAACAERQIAEGKFCYGVHTTNCYHQKCCFLLKMHHKNRLLIRSTHWGAYSAPPRLFSWTKDVGLWGPMREKGEKRMKKQEKEKRRQEGKGKKQCRKWDKRQEESGEKGGKENGQKNGRT